MLIHAVRALCNSRETRSDFRWFILIRRWHHRHSRLTDILIRGRQMNSQVIVAGVPSRSEKKKGRLIAGYTGGISVNCRSCIS